MAALNAEPADPSDRKAHHLPPKSYADAAEEGLQDKPIPYHTYIDEESIKETPPNHRQERPERRSLSEPRAFGEVLDEHDANNAHHEPATPTRMPRKPVPGKSYADAAHEHLDNSHPIFHVESELQELSGEGIDASPRSPIRRAHKRAPSKSLSRDSKDFSDQSPPAQKRDSHEQNQSQEQDISPKQIRSQERTESSQQQQNGEGNEMSEKKQKEDGRTVNENGQSKVVYERFGNGDGETLTSVKPSDDFEEALRQDKLEESSNRKEEFASGRQAGAGWGASA